MLTIDKQLVDLVVLNLACALVVQRKQSLIQAVPLVAVPCPRLSAVPAGEAIRRVGVKV
jgi:hypothetical protein